jgi:hypothetical protein
MRLRCRWLLTVLLLLPVAIVPSAARAGEPVRIRVGWVVATTQVTPLLLEKKDLLRHYGKSYTFEPVHFNDSTPQISAWPRASWRSRPWRIPHSPSRSRTPSWTSG